MSIKEFLKSKSLYFLINLLVYMLFSIIFLIAKIPIVILFLIFLIWFVPIIIYVTIQYVKENKFLKELALLTNTLDKKYLSCEVIKRPNDYEAKVIYDIICEVERNMHEEVNLYKHMNEEYREYIESWVHEIKTPIASIELMLENVNTDEKNNFRDEIDKINRYINQALFYSRSNDVSNDYLIREFNLGDVIRECIRENRRDFINKKITVELNNIDVNVICDVKWVKFIINQIIINSIKYIKNENRKILITTEENEDKRTVLKINDTGVGIPLSDINRVFDKGFTGENGRKFGKSTGIGLYLCKKLCKKLNIKISLTSEVNVGTTVSIEF